MSYCTITDVKAHIPNNALIQLTNDAGGSTVVDAVITEAINYVDNIIDGYIRGRYTLPLASTPDELKFIALDYVSYKLYARRMATEVPKPVKDAYDETVKLLKDIQSGKFSLGVESTNAYPDPKLLSNKSATVSSSNKFYTDNTWDTYGNGY